MSITDTLEKQISSNPVLTGSHNLAKTTIKIKKKGFLIPNAHIDLAWLWPKDEGEREVINTYRSAVKLMSDYPRLTFVTTSTYHLMTINESNPELFEKIRELVAEERWEISDGRIIEPDDVIISGESQVRQLLYGIGWIRQHFFYGLKDKDGNLVRNPKTNKIIYDQDKPYEVTSGYNPDAFGHQNIVHILNKAGIRNYTFLRPSPHESSLTANTFWWEGPDGSRILAGRLPKEYSAPGENIEPHVIGCYSMINKDLNVGMIAVGVGNHGGGMTEKNLLEIKKMQKDYNLAFSGLKQYYTLLNNQIQNKQAEIPSWSGDLIGHAQACPNNNDRNLKKENRDFENVLETAETIDFMAGALNPKWSNNTEKIRNIALPALINQFHDIICDTCIETVKKEVIRSYHECISGLSRIKTRALNDITSRIKIDPEPGLKPIIIFNSHAWEVYRNVESEVSDLRCQKGYQYRLIDIDNKEVPYQIIRSEALDGVKSRISFNARIPALGYTTYRLVRRPEALIDLSKMIVDEDQNKISCESSQFTFIINKFTGGIQIYAKNSLNPKTHKINKNSKNDRETGCYLFEKEYSGVPIIFEDPGDTWGHQINTWDNEIAKFKPASIQVIENGTLRTVIRVVYEYKRSRVTQDYFINNEGKSIKVHLESDLKEECKWFSLAFRLHLDHVTVTDEIPYSKQLRKADGTALPLLSWTDITGESPDTGDNYGISFLTNRPGSHSYNVKSQINGKGKELKIDIGRTPIFAHHAPASPIKDNAYRYLNTTESTQFEYEIIPHHNTLDESDTVLSSIELNQPPEVLSESYTYPLHHKSLHSDGLVQNMLPQQLSLITVESEDNHFTITVIKKAEDAGNKDLIIRGYETKGFEGKILLLLPFIKRTISFQCGKNEIVTLRISPDKKESYKIVTLLESPFISHFN